MPWWRQAAVYQVYIRSFADGDGDGTGDLAGLRSRLPYLRDLGVDGLWINPWYRSPLLDGGYDVADYREIDPRYGTVDDATAMIAEANELGLKVLVDLVPNHTSWEHAWFRAAVEAGPGSLERARYHFLPGAGPDGSEPPNDWRSVFGGPAWTRVEDGEWYLHLFDTSQPDINWTNPEVRAEFRDILRFWLDRGAAGFRVDVANSLTKAPGYPDSGDDSTAVLVTATRPNHPHWDRDDVHEIIREWRAVVEEYPDTMMVAEAWVGGWDRLARYVRPGEYHQAFDFEFLKSAWEAKALREAITTALDGAGSVGSLPTWVLSNHDVVRHPTRLGLPVGPAMTHLPAEPLVDLDPELGEHRARAAIMLMLALPGSVYLYQGEELGLPEVVDLPTDVLDDPVWERSGRRRRGRDGCRVPIPWETTGPSFGFGAGEPWLPQPASFGARSAAAQAGVDGSMLELYRTALGLRSEHLVADIDLEWIDVPGDVVSFRRGSGVVCTVNLGAEPLDVAGGDVLLASSPLDGDRLPSDTAVWTR
ncbi:MAG: glycoside hydrolase family 13 protein [Actinomycetota bacterium]